MAWPKNEPRRSPLPSSLPSAGRSADPLQVPPELKGEFRRGDSVQGMRIEDGRGRKLFSPASGPVRRVRDEML